ncbi:4-hydroxy-tetrahydrodipicolinate synthase [Ekhidna lutea]|uniref:4-hydroxy-tetrahydrodipicolinate synthase n=1 Tax=Ekhidna lutea TaxID=447679 RepID=A0A239GL24_EKHLU|nr:4-hydroxy-tetrahydrodipicolinate synthase [Ekhidna lutea]SNS69585.1 4-hydroxy-tetrahydrodipicolinate synthase [Ekhidna lutea]
MKAELKGTGVALATPMNEDYTIDYPSLGKLLDHITGGNADYIVVQGTTGESPVFSWNEKLEILQFVIDHLNGSKPVVFGLGGNNTFDLIEKSRELKDFKIAAILSASPYYNKPSQAGIIRHYQLLADAFPHPIILYNVPSRTASNIAAGSTLELAKHPNIVAVKEASGDLSQCEEINKNRPADFILLSGDDGLAYEIIKMGGEGVISVIGNIMPKAFTEMVNTTIKGDFTSANRMNEDLRIVYKMLSEEGNPSSLKAGLEAIDLCKRTVKPPLFDASDALVAKWKRVFK